jgi:hypothetical protein
MTNIVSQTFTFAVPQEGVSLNTQPGVAMNVPLDGSSSVVVPFLQPFGVYCNSVQVQYNPNAITGYVISAEVTNRTVNGFTLTVYGGPVGAVDNFTFLATGT